MGKWSKRVKHFNSEGASPSEAFQKARAENPREVAKALLSWFFLRCDSTNENDMECLRGLEDSVINRVPSRILLMEWSRIDEILGRKPVSPRLRFLLRFSEELEQENKPQQEDLPLCRINVYEQN